MNQTRELQPQRWELRIDTGGTFTDCLARDPEGQETRIKVLSSSCLRGQLLSVEGPRRVRVACAVPGGLALAPGFTLRVLRTNTRDQESTRVKDVTLLASDAGPDHDEGVLVLDEDLDEAITPGTPCELRCPEPAPLLAARLVTRTPLGRELPPMELRLATTWGTNALLTRSGTRPVLVTNEGFADLPFIANQTRRKLFVLADQRAPALHQGVIEISGRLDVDGHEIQALDLERVRNAAKRFVAAGHRSAALALLHADRHPHHERAVERALREAGFTQVSSAARLAPSIRLLPRLETAVVDAYLAPVINTYLGDIRKTLGAGRLLVMTSAGGLLSADTFRPKDSLLSGPAGGIAGAAHAGRRAGFDRLLAFDMGGTSTDVARYDGDFEYSFEQQVGDAHLVAPALAIESVAAGGGSICRFDGTRLRVGPESAAAQPGPACYGAGGPLTVTDLNLLLGRIDGTRFEIPIDRQASQDALDAVLAQLAEGPQPAPTREALLEGLLELANTKMANAIRRISLRAGYDPASFALLAFGGAGPQHAFAIAEQLGMTTVIVPTQPGLLSAEGLDDALIERFAGEQVLAPLATTHASLEERVRRLEDVACTRLAEEGIPSAQAQIRRRFIALRFAGQDAALDITFNDTETIAARFQARYREVFGHLPEGREIEVVTLRVIASSCPGRRVSKAVSSAPGLGATRKIRARFAGREIEVPVFRREELTPGEIVVGPCLIEERYSSCVVEADWKIRVHSSGALIGQRQPCPGRSHPRERPEAVRVELISQRIARIAGEMGAALERSAISTNIKERLDFSCAVLDARGELLVNAPHIPVHLGSLGPCVRKVIRVLPFEPGDCAVTNHPAFGGSHLPDVTVISPVHDDEGRVIAYVANRAHHAEIGGTLPGSMPPMARHLAEEGVVIKPTWLLRRGEARWEALRSLLSSGPWPSRAVEDNLADLSAALAANLRGVEALRELVDEIGRDTFHALCARLSERAEMRCREVLGRLGTMACESVEELDDGTQMRMKLELDNGVLTIDFAGSSDVHPGNLNATPAIVRSTVLYALRLLLDEDLPLNEGLLRPVRLKIPRGLLNPFFPSDPDEAPAVVGGNVELSQRLVNGLVRAFGLAASSQGTMNNLVLGDASRSYYETICGGCGAGPSFDGASAVHSHMTNTRITDVEILEQRYPVRVDRFARRGNSGGEGRHRGGDGVVRELTFLAPLSLSLLTQHRERGPAGLAGGMAGLPGRQRLVRARGNTEILAASDTRQVGPGDRLIIETPGGGGYGPPVARLRPENGAESGDPPCPSQAHD